MSELHTDLFANEKESFYTCPQCDMNTRVIMRRTRWQLIMSVGICHCEGNRTYRVHNVIPTERKEAQEG